MKKWLIPLIIIVIGIVVIWRFTAGFNNTAVAKEENAKLTWANVESSYQRRNDLIGNLVKTVEGADSQHLLFIFLEMLLNQYLSA